ncbi:ATP-binding protein [Oricola nitratireducens]|uniref:ATP-binding protein n=1 Tax=Oricola nitratireducens TaxID=2775868 RepID=UPI001865A70D
MRQFQFLIAIALAALVAGFAAWQAVYRSAYDELADVQRTDLVLARQSLRSEIERFRNLPRVMRHDDRIRLLVDDPSAPPHVMLVNRLLATIRDQTNADELFVLDETGRTIAASNFDTPMTFVGQNYGFRPYFRDAIATGSGQFYAVGATTGRPGYFLSSRIAGETGTGVVVVKVDMTTFAQAWRDNAPGTALMDRDGVVFLAGDPDWQYRPFSGLGEDARRRIAASRKYTGIVLEAAAPLFSPAILAAASENGHATAGDTIVSILPAGENDWHLVSASTLAPVRRAALTGGVLAGAAALLIAGALVIMRQRRSILRMKLDRNAELEAKVTERTAALAQEIEERKRAEKDLRDAQESLVQSAKLAALGRMSAAIVHEVSQPLAAMDMTLATAGAHTKSGDTGRTISALDHARETVRRMQRMVKHLKTFAKRDAGKLADIDIQSCIDAAVSLAEPRRRDADAEIVVGASAPRTFVRAGPVRLEQVFLNILINALDAVDGRDERRVTVYVETKDGVVAVSIADTGVGISETDLSRVTEPFFSTKETGEGLGLGLSISNSIIEDFGGTLAVDSAPGAGTRVRVSLPVAGGGKAGAPHPARSETVAA